MSSLSACSNTSTESGTKLIKVPLSANECLDHKYETIVSQLKKAGFSNIVLEAKDDLTSARLNDDGRILSISFNGDEQFQKKRKFPADSEIHIIYHYLPKIQLPLSSDEARTIDTPNLEALFKEAGFNTINVSETYDLDPDETQEPFMSEIFIGRKTKFEKGANVPYDSEINILKHYPYEKYNVTFIIDFTPNLLFSKYDVKVYAGDREVFYLPHGQDLTETIRLKKDTYTITFAKSDDLSIQGEIELIVDCDIEAKYKITCHGDYISINKEYEDRLRELDDDEIKILIPASSYRYKNYKDVEEEFKKMGFENIETIPIYDSIFSSSEGDVESISIADNPWFERGEVYENDDPVVITYHLLESKDPAKATPAPTPRPAATPRPQQRNGVSYSTNDSSSVKNGNSGVYAYKNRGGTYDNYWIIDFDSGYVYNFQNGNGNTLCDRVKIDSGDLNKVVIITYHDGSDTWQYGLHFAYARQPDHLILEDNDGFPYDFYSTNLEAALRIRNTMRMVDY